MNTKIVKATSKAIQRVYPLGTLQEFGGGALHYSDGSFVPIDEILDGTIQVNIKQLVQELCEELLLTRKLLKELARMKGVQIGSNNEYHREMQSLAGKLGEQSDDVKAIIEPLVRELFEDMFVSKKSKQQRK